MSFSWNPGRCRVVSAEGGRIGGTAGFMKFGFYSYDSGKLLKGFKRCGKIWFVFLESHSGPSREWNAKQGRSLNCQSVLAAKARCSDGPEVGAGREGKSTGLAGVGGWIACEKRTENQFSGYFVCIPSNSTGRSCGFLLWAVIVFCSNFYQSAHHTGS